MNLREFFKESEGAIAVLIALFFTLIITKWMLPNLESSSFQELMFSTETATLKIFYGYYVFLGILTLSKSLIDWNTTIKRLSVKEYVFLFAAPLISGVIYIGLLAAQNEFL